MAWTTANECDECRIKPGSPVLCKDCLERRDIYFATGKKHPPRKCSEEAQYFARKWDEERKRYFNCRPRVLSE